MNFVSRVVFFLLNINLVLSVSFTNDSGLPFKEECEIKFCIFKCTPIPYILYYDDPITFPELKTVIQVEGPHFDDIPVYDKRGERIVNRSLDILFLTNATEVLGLEMYINHNAVIKVYPGNKVYLYEDKFLEEEVPNVYNRFTRFAKYNYCIDYNYVNDSKEPEVIWQVYQVMAVEQDLRLSTIPMIVSATFLLLVVTVYLLLPTRTVSKYIVLGHASSQLCGFLLLTAMQIDNYIKLQKHVENTVCKHFSIVIYFFYMSSFLWLNVMSYDIWWSVKSSRPFAYFSKKTLLKYCAYGFGVPLAMSVAVAVVDNSDLTDYPYIVKPNFGDVECFLMGGEKFLYIYVPMIIILTVNGIFFIMTALIERRVFGLIAKHEGVKSNKKQRNRFVLYIKLSAVMGLNWVLELTTIIKKDQTFLTIVDILNTISVGLSVFLVFVCNRDTIRELSKRFPSLEIIFKTLYANESTKTEPQKESLRSKKFTETSITSIGSKNTTDLKSF